MKINLRRLRLKRHISIQDLSKNAGVAKSTISKIENGVTMPSIGILCKLCAALNVDIKDMVDCERGNCKDDGY